MCGIGTVVQYINSVFLQKDMVVALTGGSWRIVVEDWAVVSVGLMATPNKFADSVEHYQLLREFLTAFALPHQRNVFGSVHAQLLLREFKSTYKFWPISIDSSSLCKQSVQSKN